MTPEKLLRLSGRHVGASLGEGMHHPRLLPQLGGVRPAQLARPLDGLVVGFGLEVLAADEAAGVVDATKKPSRRPLRKQAGARRFVSQPLAPGSSASDDEP